MTREFIESVFKKIPKKVKVEVFANAYGEVEICVSYGKQTVENGRVREVWKKVAYEGANGGELVEDFDEIVAGASK